MDLLNAFRWQGSGKVYSLPWLKNRLEYCSDSKRIAAYVKTPFTRSGFVMKMLSEFHLSRHSIVVSSDSHAKWLKPISLTHMPKEQEAISKIARELIERALAPSFMEPGKHSMQISDLLIRELYRSMLNNVLNVTILTPLDEYITQTRFPHGSRPMILEGVLYSFRLHLPLLRPIRYVIDRVFFKEVLYMKRVSATLEQMVCDFTVPKPGSLFSTLAELKASGKITRAQFRGEITSMLVASFSLASALVSALLCLAARPQYQKRIRQDPTFAKYFAMEVLRLYPPFRQFGYQQAAEGGEHMSARNTDEFMIAVCALHRNKDTWENPHKFYPERFLDRRAAGGFKYLPFGMGKRSCPGRRFSLTMMIEVLKFVSSDTSPISLVKRDTLPSGCSGRLVSFAVDDTLTYLVR